MGELLNSTDPAARQAITAYNPEQKDQVSPGNLKACKAAPLESCAKLLGYLGNGTYWNKGEDIRHLHCRLCLPGSHNCEAIQKKLEIFKPIINAGGMPTGIVWLCHECLKKNLG